MAYEIPEDIPWADIADSWPAAEEALARLDQRLADSDLREAWMSRAHFRETCAALWLEGEIVALEDLVLHDGETAPTLPSRTLFQARSVLLSRRAISRTPPGEILTFEGIWALQERRQQVECPPGCEELIDFDPEWDEGARLREWLSLLKDLEALPALPATAVALKAWHDLEPFQNASATLGRLLVPALLWQRRKTDGSVLCLSLGFQQRSWIYNPQRPLARWMTDFFDAVTLAAEMGLEEHHRLRLAQQLIAQRIAGHRRNSRLPALGQLILAQPLVSVPMAAKALDMTQQGVAGLMHELTGAGVRELTGRGRYRAYGVL